MKRLLRKLKAKLLGTFVADCPVCHKHFYGHTGLHKEQIKIAKRHYRIVCGECAKKEDLT